MRACDDGEMDVGIGVAAVGGGMEIGDRHESSWASGLCLGATDKGKVGSKSWLGLVGLVEDWTGRLDLVNTQRRQQQQQQQQTAAGAEGRVEVCC